MAWHLHTERRTGRSHLDETVYLLEDTESGTRAEIWPVLGFNCLRWQTPHQGRLRDWLWSDPQLWDDPRPTRSGIPILFPFPNRIRDGRFTWNGKSYQLPINDAQKRNAIHGFVCQRPWRVADAGSNNESAWLKGMFQGVLDAPDYRSLWPADYLIEVTYTLSRDRLRFEVTVTNSDIVPLPFGLGLHPYFRFLADACQFQAWGTWERWVLEDLLPTGERVPLDENTVF